MLQTLTLSSLIRWCCTETNSVYHKKNLLIELGALHLLYINGNSISEYLLGSCLPAGQTLLAARSRSTSKKLRQQSATCEACGVNSDMFLAILANIEPVRHYIICLDCYQGDTWQTKINLKELTTKTGSSNGSRKSVSKPRKYRSVVRSEENTRETSTSKSMDENWWAK